MFCLNVTFWVSNQTFTLSSRYPQRCDVCVNINSACCGSTIHRPTFTICFTKHNAYIPQHFCPMYLCIQSVSFIYLFKKLLSVSCTIIYEHFICPLNISLCFWYLVSFCLEFFICQNIFLPSLSCIHNVSCILKILHVFYTQCINSLQNYQPTCILVWATNLLCKVGCFCLPNFSSDKWSETGGYTITQAF